MSVMNITSENFEQEIMGSDRPVLLDFWVSWCGPLPDGIPHCG